MPHRMDLVSRRDFCALGLLLSGTAMASTGRTSRVRDDGLTVLLYGDAGTGDRFQYEVGEAMWREHLKRPFDLAMSVGDNQYLPTAPGVYETVFEKPYARLVGAGVPFYQTLGNHDIEEGRGADQLSYAASVDAIARGKGGFVLPSPNYVVRRPNLKVIVASVGDGSGNIVVDNETRAFLERELSEDTPDWRILVTHYPLYSTGPRGDNKALQGALLPLLERYPVDMYLCGHEHHAEVLLPWNWMTQAIVGNGREIRPGRRTSERTSLYFMDQIGFAKLRLWDDVARLAFINARNEEVYSTTFQKRVPLWADIDGQSGGRLVVRLKVARGVAVDTVEAQVGYSKEPTNPALTSRGWTWVPLSYDFYDPRSRLDMYSAPVPSDRSGQYAAVRFRVAGEARWIYADDGRGPKNGNYDGIGETDLVRVL